MCLKSSHRSAWLPWKDEPEAKVDLLPRGVLFHPRSINFYAQRNADCFVAAVRKEETCESETLFIWTA
jgi:hypothetical protein